MLHEVLFGLLGHGMFAAAREREEGLDGGEAGLEAGLEAENEAENESRNGAPRRRGAAALDEDAARCRVPAFLVPGVVSASEAASIEVLMATGRRYSQLQLFVERHRGGATESALAPRSLVLQALCLGVQELLDWHHAAVCRAEQVVLSESLIPLSRLHYMMADSAIVLSGVLAVCAQVERERLVGGQVADRLYTAAARCGVAVLRRRLERLLRLCARVLFNMIEAWVVHGVLLDRCGEFFVQERPYEVSVPRAQDEDELGAAAPDGEQHPLIAEYEWRSQFRLREAMIPASFFPRDLADKVLFAGKANRVLLRSRLLRQQGPGGSARAGVEDEQEDEQGHDRGPGKHARADDQERAGGEAYEDEDEDEAGGGSGEDEDEQRGRQGQKDVEASSAASCASSSSDVLGDVRRAARLDPSLLGRRLRAYYFRVALRLQKLVVRHAQLAKHLTFVREFFLLGRGELFTSLIHLGAELLASPPRPTLAAAEQAINAGPWREAALQSGSEEWPALTRDAFATLKLVLQRGAVDFSDGFGVPTGAATGPSAERSRLSDIVLVGEAVVERGAVVQAAPRSGLWYGAKLPVERGFSCQVRFTHRLRAPSCGAAAAAAASAAAASTTTTTTVDGRGATAMALALHHDASVGPTALGTEGRFAHSTLGNCVSFVAYFSPSYSTAQLRVEGEGGGVLLQGEEAPLRAASTGLATSAQYSLAVEHRLEGEEKIAMVVSMTLRAAGASGGSPSSVVATLKGSLDLGTAMNLERGSGRAWVGLLSGGVPLPAAAAAAAPSQVAATEVTSWRLESEQGGDRSDEFDPWRSLLTLEMRVDWPLHLVLTQSAMDQYGMLFRFLLILKRVEAALKEAWAVLNQSRFKLPQRQGGPAAGEEQRRLMLLWRLRSAMAYLVNHLQYHLQVDVIDSLQAALLRAICDARDFVVVATAHQKFVDQLVTRSFLHNKVVRNTIDTVLRRCLRFCGLVGKLARVDAPLRPPQAQADLDEAFKELADSFTRDATFLYALLARINSNLLLRVDYNSFFSKLARQDTNTRFKF
jgi:hypothetical protein